LAPNSIFFGNVYKSEKMKHIKNVTKTLKLRKSKLKVWIGGMAG
jgi:hypothetical protein